MEVRIEFWDFIKLARLADNISCGLNHQGECLSIRLEKDGKEFAVTHLGGDLEQPARLDLATAPRG